MLRIKSGFSALVKRDAPEIISTHCMLHRHALASKTLPPTLLAVMNDAISIINVVKGSACNSRLFKKLCEDLGSEHSVLLFHTEVRWLSRGLALKRLLELKDEVYIFLNSKTNILSYKLESPIFLIYLAYLGDIFTIINESNLSIQGKNNNIFNAKESITALKDKLNLWAIRVINGNFTNFILVESMINVGVVCSTEKKKEIQIEIHNHLKILSIALTEYFNFTDSSEHIWISNPFKFNLEEVDDNDIVKEHLIDLRNRRLYFLEFCNNSLSDFWILVKEEYPVLSEKALNYLIPFTTTYLCESGFSTLLSIKTKYRNRMDVSHFLRVSLTITEPMIEEIINSMQNQGAH
jgi:hypothetical protein